MCFLHHIFDLISYFCRCKTSALISLPWLFLFMQRILIERLLFTNYCSRHLKCNNGQNRRSPCSPKTHMPVWTDNKQINTCYVRQQNKLRNKCSRCYFKEVALMDLSRSLNTVKEHYMQTSEQRMSWAEGTTSAKALRQEWEMCSRSSMGPAQLKQMRGKEKHQR